MVSVYVSAHKKTIKDVSVTVGFLAHKSVTDVQEYFEDLVKFMASGPSHVLVLTKGQTDDSIIHDWRDMLGPPSVEEAKEQAPNRYLLNTCLVLNTM